jgi:hypothetical protein
MANALQLLAFSADLRSAHAVPSNFDCLRQVLAGGSMSAALLASALAFFTARLRQDRLPFLIGLALLGCSLTEGLGVLADLPAAPEEGVLSRTSLASGPVEACLLGASALFFLAKSAPVRRGAALAGLAALGLWIYFLLRSGFRTDRNGAILSAWAFGGIFVFLANGIIFLRLKKKRPGPLALSLLLSVLPQLAAHLFVVISPLSFSTQRLEMAYPLRGAAFLILLAGVLGEIAAAFGEREGALQGVLEENRVLRENQVQVTLPLKGLDAETVQAVEKWGLRLAHDVKSPLASLSMGVDLLLRHCPRGAETEDLFKEIESAISKTRSIMRALGSPVDKRGGEDDVKKA